MIDRLLVGQVLCTNFANFVFILLTNLQNLYMSCEDVYACGEITCKMCSGLQSSTQVTPPQNIQPTLTLSEHYTPHMHLIKEVTLSKSVHTTYIQDKFDVFQ